MIKKLRKPELIPVWIFFFGLAGLVVSVRLDGAEQAERPFEVSIAGEGIYLNRSQQFKIGNTAEWGNVVLNGRSGQEDSLAYDLDQRGGGYRVEAAIRGKAWDFETGFRQFFTQAQKEKTELPGVGAGKLTEMAFIDGRAHATPQTFGFFLSAAPIAGQSRPGIAALDYCLNAFEIPFYAVHPLAERGRFEASIFAGPVYTRFSQQFRVNTSDTNAVTGSETSSETTESLTENLFGARLGLRGGLRAFSDYFMLFEHSSGFFVSRGRLTAVQEITHGSGNAGGGVTFSNLNENISVRDTEISAVPHFLTSAEIGTHFGERITVSVFGRFEQWLGLSNIENPVVSANLRSILNGPARLRDDQDLYAFSLGGEVVIAL